MGNIIDIRDLPEKEVRLVREFVEFLKQKTKAERSKGRRKRAKRFVFSAHHSDVIGDLTRREMYEDR